jgi:hypothetical protein
LADALEDESRGRGRDGSLYGCDLKLIFLNFSNDF